MKYSEAFESILKEEGEPNRMHEGEQSVNQVSFALADRRRGRPRESAQQIWRENP